MSLNLTDSRDAEHPGDREAPHVGVQHADPVSLGRERDRQVHRDARLADAALARGDRDHTGRTVREERAAALARPRRPVPEPLDERGSLLLAHRRHPHVHLCDAEGRERRPHVAGDAVLQRTARDREQHVDADGAVHLDALEHVEILDRLADLGSRTLRSAVGPVLRSPPGELLRAMIRTVRTVAFPSMVRRVGGAVDGASRRRPRSTRRWPTTRGSGSTGTSACRDAPCRSASSTRLSLHPNTLRPHLRRLEEVGLVESEIRKGATVGRPQTLYTVRPRGAGAERLPSAWPRSWPGCSRAGGPVSEPRSSPASGGVPRPPGWTEARHAAPARRNLAILQEAMARAGFDPRFRRLTPTMVEACPRPARSGPGRRPPGPGVLDPSRSSRAWSTV